MQLYFLMESKKLLTIEPEYFLKKREKDLDHLDSGRIARINKVSERKQLKVLTPKQTLQKLPIALVQVKADNTSENLLNEIRQVIYSLYQAKEITKKVYNYLMNSIKL